MSRPWRGGYGKKRPFSKGPRGGYHNSNARYTHWDKDKRPQDEQNSNNEPPVYMNPNRPPFWQDCYDNYQQQPAQQFQPSKNYGPNPWIVAFNNYRYPPPTNTNNKQYGSGQTPENNERKTLLSNPKQVNLQENGNKKILPSTSTQSKQSNETSQSKASEEPVIAHPGSEAAREKERAEIAARLKQLDTNKIIAKDPKENDNKSETLINEKKRTLSLSKSDEKDAKRSKKTSESTSSSDKSKCANSKKEMPNSQNKGKESPSQKKLNAASSSKTSNSKISASGQKRKDKQPVSKKSSSENQSSRKANQTLSSSKELPSQKENKLLSRLAAMGKEDLKSLINNPQLPKSQEMLKALMKCYQETKALELDKRRFTISTTADQSSASGNIMESNLFNLLDLPSIAMSDLPSELVNQIETFLGFDISMPSAMANQTQDHIHNNDTFSSPHNSREFQMTTNPDTPFNTHNMSPQYQGQWINLPTTTNEGTDVLEQNNEFQRIQLNRQPSVGSDEQNQTTGDNISVSSAEKAPSPYQSYINDNQQNFHNNLNQNFNLPPYFDPSLQNHYGDRTAFNIVNELKIINLRMEADLRRKTQLTEELDMYLLNSMKQQYKNAFPSAPIENPQINQPMEQFVPPIPVYHNQSVSNINPEKSNSPFVECVVPMVQNESDTLVMPPRMSPCDFPPPRNSSYNFSSLSEIPLKQKNVPPKNKQSPIVVKLDEDNPKIAAPASSPSAKKVGCIGCLPLVLIPDKTVVKLSSKTKVNDMKVVNNDTVVVACEDCIIYAYDLKTGKETHKFREHTSSVTAVQPTLKKNKMKEVITGEFILCSGGLDEMLCFFDSQSQSCISKQYLASHITCLEFSPPNLLYIGVHCGQVYTCNVDTQQLINNPMECSNNSILSILATKEGPRNVLIISSIGKPIVMKDAQDGLFLRSFTMSWQQKTFGLAVFGNQLFCGTMKKCIPYYNLMTGELEGELNVSSNVAFITAYKHLLFVACCLGQIFVFDLKNKEKVTELPGATSDLKVVQINSNRIISCGRQKKIEAICFPAELIRNIRSSCTCKSS